MKTAEIERPLWTAVLLAVVAAFAYFTLELGPTARRVPQVIIAPTLILLVTQLLLDLRSLGWHRASTGTSLDWLVGSPVEHSSSVSRSDQERRDPESKGRKEITMLAWLFLLPMLIVGFGELIAMPVFTFVYLGVRARKSWLVSAAIAAVMACVTYLVIRVLLSVPPYEGRISSWLGGGW